MRAGPASPGEAPATALRSPVTSGRQGRLRRVPAGRTLGSAGLDPRLLTGHLRAANLPSVVRSCCVSMPGGSGGSPLSGEFRDPVKAVQETANALTGLPLPVALVERTSHVAQRGYDVLKFLPERNATPGSRRSAAFAPRVGTIGRVLTLRVDLPTALSQARAWTVAPMASGWLADAPKGAHRLERVQAMPPGTELDACGRELLALGFASARWSAGPG